MKTIFALFLILLVLGFWACGEKDNSENEEVKPAAEIPKTDLHSAVVTDDLEVIQQHINAGSDLNVLEPTRKSTPLITAAAFGKTEAARLLIAAGASLNYQNADGSTALHTSSVFGTTEVARLLIDAGTDLNTINKEGSAPVHTASFFGHTEIVKALVDNGADKTLKNGHGQTAYEVVSIPFEDIKFIYDGVGQAMKPMGLVLDYEKIKQARPIIAEMLK